MNTARDDIADQGSNGARRMGRNASRAAERARRSSSPNVADLIADVEDLLQKVGYIADSEVVQIRERLQEKIASAKDTLSNQGMQIANAARSTVGATDDFVNDNPWKSTGIAALAGVMLALIIFRS
jgi:ElaB/YqjD/DUF883 family membrane-anchored ribosome-binding protein